MSTGKCIWLIPGRSIIKKATFNAVDWYDALKKVLSHVHTTVDLSKFPDPSTYEEAKSIAQTWLSQIAGTNGFECDFIIHLEFNGHNYIVEDDFTDEVEW